MLIVVHRNDLLMFLAISARYQPGETGIRTGALRLIRHSCRLFPDRKKAPAVCSAKTSVFFFVAIVILPDFHGVFLCLLVFSFQYYSFSIARILRGVNDISGYTKL